VRLLLSFQKLRENQGKIALTYKYLFNANKTLKILSIMWNMTAAPAEL